MQTLAMQILKHATGMPEGTPLVAKELWHLNNGAAGDQVLSASAAGCSVTRWPRYLGPARRKLLRHPRTVDRQDSRRLVKPAWGNNRVARCRQRSRPDPHRCR